MVFQAINEFDPNIYTKSSLMLGLGETEQEIIEVMKDLRSREVRILTIGQNLQPSSRHLPVTEYITHDRFDWFAEAARQLGFSYVASGSMVRSSYKVGEFFQVTELIILKAAIIDMDGLVNSRTHQTNT